MDILRDLADMLAVSSDAYKILPAFESIQPADLADVEVVFVDHGLASYESGREVCTALQEVKPQIKFYGISECSERQDYIPPQYRIGKNPV